MRKQLRRVHRVVVVLLATKITAHLDVLAFGQDAVGLGLSQAADHLTHAFAVATADKTGRSVAGLRCEMPHLFLPKQAVQHLLWGQIQQLF
jgi:hypothetical protein